MISTRSTLNCCRPACFVSGLQNSMVLGGGGLGGGMISTPAQLLQMRLSPLRHSLAQPLAPGPWVIILFSLFVLPTFCCCVSRVHPAPLLTRGSRHFGRVIRSCWTLTLKCSLVRLILSRILRHLLVRYRLEALCPGVGSLKKRTCVGQRHEVLLFLSEATMSAYV